MRPGIGGVFDLTSLPVVGTFDHSPGPGGGLNFSLQPLVDRALPAPSWISAILDDRRLETSIAILKIPRSRKKETRLMIRVV